MKALGVLLVLMGGIVLLAQFAVPDVEDPMNDTINRTPLPLPVLSETIYYITQEKDVNIVSGFSGEDDPAAQAIWSMVEGENVDEDIIMVDDRSILRQNFVVVLGGPCANTMAAGLLERDGITCSNWPFPDGEAIIRLYLLERTYLVIAGTTASDTLYAANYVNRYQSHDFEDNNLIIPTR